MLVVVQLSVCCLPHAGHDAVWLSAPMWWWQQRCLRLNTDCGAVAMPFLNVCHPLEGYICNIKVICFLCCYAVMLQYSVVLQPLLLCLHAELLKRGLIDVHALPP